MGSAKNHAPNLNCQHVWIDNGTGSFDNPPMLQLEEARRRVLAAIEPLPAEAVPLSGAVGRVLAETILAPLDLPLFDNSAMDGYAVRAADLARARAEAPVALRLAGQVAAGETLAGGVSAGTCVRLFTGSPLPAEADAVVMQEDTRPSPDAPGQVLFLETVKPWENLRLRGEDVKRGSPLVQAGERLTAGAAGLLAAVGIREIRAGRRPVIGLLATGSELTEAGQPLAPGRIYESNRISLAPWLAEAGAVPRVFPLVRDTLAETRAALEQALAECDGVVTTGGVSVGELDFVKQAFVDLGGVMDFWKVAIKPGKPFVFGRCGGKFLFSLPGNPVSALVTFLLLARPALLRWQGAARVELPAMSGVLAEPLANRGDRRHFLRVIVDEQGGVRSAGAQASHFLSSLARANGLVEVPPATTLAEGTRVQVLRLEV